MDFFCVCSSRVVPISFLPFFLSHLSHLFLPRFSMSTATAALVLQSSHQHGRLSQTRKQQIISFFPFITAAWTAFGEIRFRFSFSAGSLCWVKIGNLLLLATGHQVYPAVSKTLHFKKNLIIIRSFHLVYFTRLIRKLFPNMMQMFAQISSAPFSTCRCPPL